jgi:hypothetical protein
VSREWSELGVELMKCRRLPERVELLRVDRPSVKKSVVDRGER